MSEPRICLVHLFNHRHEANVRVLERIYGGRFGHRHILMPFSTAPGPNISRVYEPGRNFSGHIAQGARDFMGEQFTHYVIAGDDLLLNPQLDETNLIGALGLRPGEGYIKNLVAADALRGRWIWAGEAAAKFRRNAKAIDLGPLLPSADEARAKFAALQLTFPARPAVTLSDQLRFARQSVWAALEGMAMHRRPADYPLLSGYADFIVVPADAMAQFVHFCGVFAALDIFAEVAVPTALALAASKVRTELPVGHHFVPNRKVERSPGATKGVELWDKADSQALDWLLSLPLDALLARFPADWLYIHPVKLSRYADG